MPEQIPPFTVGVPYSAWVWLELDDDDRLVVVWITTAHRHYSQNQTGRDPNLCPSCHAVRPEGLPALELPFELRLEGSAL